MDVGDVERKPLRSLPWCSLILVAMTITAHCLVLMGNLTSAESFNKVGRSTQGWSDVGLAVSDSLSNELLSLMNRTSRLLTEALAETSKTEQTLNLVLGSSGNATQEIIDILAADGNTEHGVAALVVLEDPNQSEPAGGWEEGILPRFKNPSTQDVARLKGVLKQRISMLIQDLNVQLAKFWETIEPALLQIGKWLSSMGTKMQGFIEQFATTIDKAQKIFDQVMEQLSGKADVKEQLVYHTFNIFDITGKGNISADDIQQVTALYGVTALAGDKGNELHKKYDANENGELDQAEYSRFVDDPSIPSVMTYVLRTFSKKLMQIVGQMQGAHKRDEVAETVVAYFELMVAKNLTKVQWVSQSLSNGSLPLEFTADVFRQLVLQDRAPDKLTNLSVGQTVITYMVELNAPYVAQVVQKVADAAWWSEQGFVQANQPVVVEQVRRWVQQAMSDSVRHSLLSTGVSVNTHHDVLLGELADLTAETLSKRMQHHQQAKRRKRVEQHQKVFHSEATRHLFRHLLGQAGPSSMVGSSNDLDIARVVQGGVAAKPETLMFAQWLVNNASRTSAMFQNYSFEYAKTSSNPIDNFANQIQALVKKVQQFLDLMMSYSTDRGIEELHQQIQSFASKSEADINNVVERLIDQAVQQGRRSTTGSASMLSLGSRTELGISDSWKDIQEMMAALKGTLPTVIDDIKFAQKEVSSVAATLHSTFTVFRAKGSPIFYEVGSLYKIAWIVYFCLFMALTLLVLFYAFWAQGYFGGPSPSSDRCCSGSSCRERCGTCWNACLSCLRDIQDGHLCFWSCILLSEVVILLMFLVSILLSLVAGLKAFISMGCGQIYVLGDDRVCTSIMTGLRDWLESFWTGMPGLLDQACNQHTLVTCAAISDKMTQSVMYTIVGSFAAAIFSIQLLFRSAQLHEHAVWANKFK